MATYLHSILFDAHIKLADTVFASIDLEWLTLTTSGTSQLRLTVREHLVIDVSTPDNKGRLDVLRIIYVDEENAQETLRDPIPAEVLSLDEYAIKIQTMARQCTRARLTTIVDQMIEFGAK
jgi:hypothetical protein